MEQQYLQVNGVDIGKFIGTGSEYPSRDTVWASSLSWGGCFKQLSHFIFLHKHCLGTCDGLAFVRGQMITSNLAKKQLSSSASAAVICVSDVASEVGDLL